MGSMLTLQTIGAGEATMSSREIANLTGKRHDNVMRVCHDLKVGGVIPQAEECRVINELANGREFTEFRLSKRDSLVLVARLSPEFTARLVDRWQELEAKSQAPAELSRMQILELAMQSERERLVLTEQLAAAKPAVEFVERYADATGTKGFREVAKILRANEHQFRDFLVDEKIMYRLAGTLTPYGHHIDAGRFCVKTGTSQANGHAYSAARFTAKGVTWIAGEWAKWQLTQREAGHV